MEPNSPARVRVLLIGESPESDQLFREDFRSRATLVKLPDVSEPSDSGLQNSQAIAMAHEAFETGRPYSLVILTARGTSAIDTIKWMIRDDPDLQVLVLCDGPDDWSDELPVEVGDRVICLTERLSRFSLFQLAIALAEKSRLARQERIQLETLERCIEQHHRDQAVTRQASGSLQAILRRGRPRLERDLTAAVRDGDLVMQYQPVIEIESGYVASLDAVLRWEHSRFGLMTSSELTAIAEGSDFGTLLDKFAIQQVCKQQVLWSRSHVPVQREAVALCARPLAHQPAQEWVKDILEELGPQPRKLALRVRVVSLTHPECAQFLQRLRTEGIEIHVEDSAPVG